MPDKEHYHTGFNFYASKASFVTEREAFPIITFFASEIWADHLRHLCLLLQYLLLTRAINMEMRCKL